MEHTIEELQFAATVRGLVLARKHTLEDRGVEVPSNIELIRMVVEDLEGIAGVIADARRAA